MNREEAIALLEVELAAFREESYTQLVGRVSAEPLAFERAARGGVKYQLEIQVFWDARPGGNTRVVGCIDDGGWRAFAPLSCDFIKAPDGSFVGE